MARIETTSPDFQGGIKRLWDQLSKAFNGNVSFGDGTSSDNVAGAWAGPVITVVSPGVFVVTHNLGRIPVGWFIAKKDGFEDVKFISSTTTTLTLSGQVGGINITLFVI